MNFGNELTGLIILIIDDQPDNIEVAKVILSSFGIKVLTAQNGPDGLKLLKDHRVDLVLLDISMPEMDGWEVLKEIRKDFGSLPVIALTAHVHPADRDQILQAGFDYFIAKPFRIGTFLGEVKRVIGRQYPPPTKA
jgi:CheY-like chemotaxis protein